MSDKDRRTPPRLNTIFQRYGAPIYFVTFNTWQRKNILDCNLVHEVFVSHAKKVASIGVGIGRYVIMPDHIHLFIRISPELKLGESIKHIKQAMTKALRKQDPQLRVWQPGFFDRLLRDSDSYAQKWEYVRENPVRAELVESSESWLYQGEIISIQAL